MNGRLPGPTVGVPDLSGLDLHEGEGPAVEDDEIYLSTRCAVVPCQQLKAACQEMLEGELLTHSAQLAPGILSPFAGTRGGSLPAAALTRNGHDRKDAKAGDVSWGWPLCLLCAFSASIAPLA